MLLGAHLIHGELRARIVEVEAYRATDDPGSHAYRKQTSRNAVMFGPSGRAYVYFNYGVHWMLNVSAHEVGSPAAILIRAAEPLSGLNHMRERRGLVPDSGLLSGPGKLTQAFGITAEHQGSDLFATNVFGLRIEAGEPARRIVTGPRVGLAVGKGEQTPWRFIDADRMKWVSKPWPK